MTPTDVGFDPKAAYVALSDDQIAQLRRFGMEHAVQAGETIFEAGQTAPSLVVVLSGRVTLFDCSDEVERVIQDAGPGEFIGELSLLTGQIAMATCAVEEAGTVLLVSPDNVRRAIATVPSLGDVLVTAFSIRRKLLMHSAINAVTLIGPQSSRALLRVAEFVNRNRIPFRWLSPDDPVALGLLDRVAPGKVGEVWAIVRDQVPLSDPDPLGVARALGLDLAVGQQAPADLIIVGGGPAGLSAAVYGASEGLSTIVVDNVAIGGQAGASSRIENYLGFPTGISGGDLAFRAEVQALKFGARIAVPSNAISLQRNDGLFEIVLENGRSLFGRSVVVATGANYRTIGLLGENELSGIFYAATELEARFCSRDPVVVVGGGNSAGQAAMFLSERSPMVYLVHRRDNLESSMSHYLISRLVETPNVELHLATTVTELRGSDRLASVIVQHRSGRHIELAAGALFVMVGTDPCTTWLRGSIALDPEGFALTGSDLPAPSAGESRSTFETSQPGIFAVGDVRSGSVKRVASAVGEGSVVIQAVHRYLAANPNSTAI